MLRQTPSESWETTVQGDIDKDLHLDLNLGFYEAISGCEKEVSIRHLEVEPDGDLRMCGKRLKLTIPAGVTPGTRLRVAREGHASAIGGQPGDLYLHLKVTLQAEGLTRDGEAISSEITITELQAQQGTIVTVQTIDGDKKVTILPGVISGSRMVLKGLGVPKLGSPNERGDHLLRVAIASPIEAPHQPQDLPGFSELKSILDWLAGNAWTNARTSDETLWTDKTSLSEEFVLEPSDLSPANYLNEIVTILLERARVVAPGLRVPQMLPPVTYGPIPFASGLCCVEYGQTSIRVSREFYGDKLATQAILAHEVCHYILNSNDLGLDRSALNDYERCTDLCMFVCGFGQIFLAGYKKLPESERFGYLTEAEYEFAADYVMKLRPIYQQKLKDRLELLKQQLEILKQQLLQKTNGDLDLIERLIAYERNKCFSDMELLLREVSEKANTGGKALERLVAYNRAEKLSRSEIELYQNAIDRLDRDRQ